MQHLELYFTYNSIFDFLTNFDETFLMSKFSILDTKNGKTKLKFVLKSLMKCFFLEILLNFVLILRLFMTCEVYIYIKKNPNFIKKN